MRSLIVEPEAEQELGDAIAWYEEAQPGLGAALIGEVDRVVERLLQEDAVGFRAVGVPPELEVRRVILDRFPYSVVYMEHASTVHVIAFAHHRRRPGYWAERL